MLSFLLALVFLQGSTAQVAESACRATGELTRLRELPEASGVAASRRSPGIFWAHNDSGHPVLVALNEQGGVVKRVTMNGANVDDWEDIAVGPCGQASCVYVADIGDNNENRDRITIYRVPEPSLEDAAIGPAEIFEAVYPDGAHDAEALFVSSAGDVYIITKGDPGPVVLYRFPRPLTPGKRVQLERVGAPMIDAKRVDPKDRPTGADVSADGTWVAIRTTDHVVFHRTDDVVAGRWREALRADVAGLKEPRGEGITFARDGTVVLVGEGGGLSAPGTFARLTCRLPR